MKINAPLPNEWWQIFENRGPQTKPPGICNMYVADIMTKNPVIVHLDDTLRVALLKMEEIGCHHLPVVGIDGHLVGIVSERDCRRAIHPPNILRDRHQVDALADNLPVRGIMTPAPIIIEPDAPAEEAARLMLGNHIGCLPVMRSETLIGIITRSDILMAFMNLQRQRVNGDIPDTPKH